MYEVFSLMCPASMQNNWSKSKHLHKIKSQFNSRKIGWNTFMAAVLFFWNFNMAAVKSCQNALYNDHHLHIVCIYTSFVILYCIPFRCVRFSSKRARSYFIRRHKLELIFRRTFCLDLLAIGFFSCNIQSGPLIFTFSSVAYCMKQYRAVTWWWFPGPLHKDSTLIFIFARYNVEHGRARSIYKTRQTIKTMRKRVIL